MISKFSIPFVDLTRQFKNIESELLDEFIEVGRSGVYVLGEKVEYFEEQISKYCGVRFAVSVANGSDALFLCLKALGIGPGDEVITPATSFIASTWVIEAAGAKPVLVDVRDDLNIDPEKMSEAVTKNTKCIIPVHFAGRSAPMNEIMRVADKGGIKVLEDAAQAIGARYHNKSVGSFGIAGGFSLHPLKNLGLYGDGGVITTDDESLAKKLRLLRNHGLESRDHCTLWGYNSRLDSIQAAFASVKLKYLDVWNERCRAISLKYQLALKDYTNVPYDKPWEKNVYHNFIITTPSRDRLKAHLEGVGIGTAIHYPVPIHLQPVSRKLGYGIGSFPVSERLAETMLSLPIYPELLDSEIDQVISEVRKFIG